MKRAALLVLAMACSPPPERGEDAAAAGTPPPVRPAEVWTTRELDGAPRGFGARGWIGDSALWGVVGEVPTVVRLDGSVAASWRTPAWVPAMAPEGSRLAWIDEAGRWVLVGTPGEPPRRVLDLRASRPPEGADPSGVLAWSPDGVRLLVGWAEEWNGLFGVVEVESGRFTRLRTRLEGYYLTTFEGWLDPQRLLFSTHPVPPQYSESGGTRADLAVL
ncbi:MAG TPA: hypothetical protein VFX98_02820, partial [Longimicrobiaceae bacterium]|nr:hypothetical protein [Longimicrobiaceae bacterium]